LACANATGSTATRVFLALAETEERRRQRYREFVTGQIISLSRP